MGTSLSCSYQIEHTKPDKDAVQKLRQAEEDLFRFVGVWSRVSELHLELEGVNGVTTARVLKVTPEGDADEIPVVMVHGGGGSPGDFCNLLPPLMAANERRTIYLVERPGNGLSPAMDYSKVHLPDFCALFLEQVMTALELDRAHFVGHSFGGGFILWYALQTQQRHASIASISLVGMPAGCQGMAIPVPHCIIRFLLYTKIDFATCWLGVLFTYIIPYLRVFPLLLLWIAFRVPYHDIRSEFLVYCRCLMGIRQNSLSFQSAMHQLLLAATTSLGWKLEDLHDLQEYHDIPILFVEGEGEPFLSTEQSQKITKFIGCNHHLLIGKGHVPWASDPEGVAYALTQFWAGAETQS